MYCIYCQLLNKSARRGGSGECSAAVARGKIKLPCRKYCYKEKYFLLYVTIIIITVCYFNVLIKSH